jgi:hypothetical protein
VNFEEVARIAGLKNAGAAYASLKHPQKDRQLTCTAEKRSLIGASRLRRRPDLAQAMVAGRNPR